MEVDHDKQVVYTETLALALHEPDLLLAAMQPSEEHVAGRLTSPIVSTHLDTRNIAFERWVGSQPVGGGGPRGGRWRRGEDGEAAGRAGEGEGTACARGCATAGADARPPPPGTSRGSGAGARRRWRWSAATRPRWVRRGRGDTAGTPPQARPGARWG